MNSLWVLICLPATCCHFLLQWDMQISLPCQGAGILSPGQQFFHVQIAQAIRNPLSQKTQCVIKDFIIKELFALQSGSVQLSPHTQEACCPHPFRTSKSRWKPQCRKRHTHESGLFSSRHMCSAHFSSSTEQWVGHKIAATTTSRARFYFYWLKLYKFALQDPEVQVQYY